MVVVYDKNDEGKYECLNIEIDKINNGYKFCTKNFRI